MNPRGERGAAQLAREWQRRYPGGYNNSKSLAMFADEVRARIVQLAPLATALMRRELREALHYVLCYVEEYERVVVVTAQKTMEALPPVTDVQFEVALAELKPKRKSSRPQSDPREFVPGRGLPTPKRKRLTAGRTP